MDLAGQQGLVHAQDLSKTRATAVNHGRDWDTVDIGADVLLELLSPQSLHKLVLGFDDSIIVKLRVRGFAGRIALKILIEGVAVAASACIEAVALRPRAGAGSRPETLSEGGKGVAAAIRLCGTVGLGQGHLEVAREGVGLGRYGFLGVVERVSALGELD